MYATSHVPANWNAFYIAIWTIYGPYMDIWAIYGHIWSIHGHIWPIYGHISTIYGHIWTIYGHIWTVRGAEWAGGVGRIFADLTKIDCLTKNLIPSAGALRQFTRCASERRRLNPDKNAASWTKCGLESPVVMQFRVLRSG